MNCDEFQQQFQRWLDRREGSPDQEMQEHADQCGSCRHQLQLWQTIETSLATTTQRSNSQRTNVPSRALNGGTLTGRAIIGVAVAACMAIAFVMPRTSDPIADSQSLTSIDSQLIESSSQLDPSGWWNDMRDRDWVSPAMPTVRIVRDGVAPLGRSIQRAATLLTTAPREQTS